MTTNLWLAVAGIALVAIAALLALLLLRVQSLYRAASITDTRTRLDAIGAQNERLERELRAELAQARSEAAQQAQLGRGELAAAISRFAQEVQTLLGTIAQLQNERLSTLTQSNEARLEAVRATVEQRLELLRTDNAQKLEHIRTTVDEKLHATLEQRLGASFQLVSDRLEQVHKGLGEMQTLAAGVGDLKKVLTNIKTRGTWGEVQLENLLEQMLTPAQYSKNVATRPGQSARVEFAIRMPGRDEGNHEFWLPIDAKFPLEDFQRLQEAQERADLSGVETFGKALEDRVRKQARDINEKYIEPPHTTDFALLYLPVESLYAEVLRRPGLIDIIQREHQVTLAGPTTLAAILNSLQMGFRTLAIERRSGEVWRLLAAVKTEFGTFGDILARTKKQLESVSNTLDAAEVRTRSIERKLRGVEVLPESEAAQLLREQPSLVIDVNPSNDESADLDLDPSASTGGS
ncbi:MAG TPA: DNA recombination protein RmuC [Casimicrobiaceae bacterium]|nr:DNA recombination protein RmuC [Casimicrobiaceae bacterium]